MKILFFLLLSFNAHASYVGVARGAPGIIFTFGGTSCPTHSQAADGSSVLRAGTYANLFSAISTAYGAADGTHFNVPDLRGKFARGFDGPAGNDPDESSRTACNTGGATGNNVGSCQLDAFQSHKHGMAGHAGGTTGSSTSFLNDNDGTNNAQLDTLGITAGRSSTETRPLNVGVLYCIWY